jgi:transcription termination factor Rho
MTHDDPSIRIIYLHAGERKPDATKALNSILSMNPKPGTVEFYSAPDTDSPTSDLNVVQMTTFAVHRARRLVEMGTVEQPINVILFWDSGSRGMPAFSRASEIEKPEKDSWISKGLTQSSLAWSRGMASIFGHFPFGSLTIIMTALVTTEGQVEGVFYPEVGRSLCTTRKELMFNPGFEWMPWINMNSRTRELSDLLQSEPGFLQKMEYYNKKVWEKAGDVRDKAFQAHKWWGRMMKQEEGLQFTWGMPK